jgi:hypothetical protein
MTSCLPGTTTAKAAKVPGSDGIYKLCLSCSIQSVVRLQRTKNWNTRIWRGHAGGCWLATSSKIHVTDRHQIITNLTFDDSSQADRDVLSLLFYHETTLLFNFFVITSFDSFPSEPPAPDTKIIYTIDDTPARRKPFPSCELDTRHFLP